MAELGWEADCPIALASQNRELKNVSTECEDCECWIERSNEKRSWHNQNFQSSRIDTIKPHELDK